MTRALTSGMQTELSKVSPNRIHPFFLFEGVFASSTLRLWDGIGDLSWNSQTWLGNGWLKGFSDVKESGVVRANGLDVLLSGVPQALVSLILTEARHTCRATLRLGCFDDSGAIVADPYILFEGGLSSPRITDSGDSSEVTLSYEDDLVILQKSSDLRWNDASQRSLFPDDRGFEYIPALQSWTGFWGNKTKPKVAKDKKSTKKNKDKSRRR